MHLPTYLTLLSSSEETLAISYRRAADGYADESDVFYRCDDFSRCCTRHVEALTPIAGRYEDHRAPEPDRLRPSGVIEVRGGPVGLLRDLQDLYQLASLVEITWSLVGQAAAGARDRDLLDLVGSCRPETTAQLAWLRTRMQASAAQTLLVA